MAKTSSLVGAAYNFPTTHFSAPDFFAYLSSNSNKNYAHAIRGRLLSFGRPGRPPNESINIHRLLNELCVGATKIVAARKEKKG
jgi:hypothetical protein